MDNFNLRYECLDSKDDFHVQLRKDQGMESSWDAEYGHNNFVKDSSNTTSDITNIIPENLIISEVIGQRERRRQTSLNLMTRIMQRLGWGQPKISLKNLKPCVSEPIKYQPSSTWKTLIAEKKKEILNLRLEKIPDGTVLTKSRTNYVSKDVFVADLKYFKNKFKSPKWNNVVKEIMQEFNLNREQQRAFCIPANYITSLCSEPLRMYIGGMGGTGKSQVLKSLIKFFKLRGKSHRLVVVVLTGNAASLLGSSTYHYMFGINDQTKLTKTTLPGIKDRLFGVDYIFFDEVSMLSCRDLFCISHRLSEITGLSEPFGGFNIIFAGDFAQLPPPMGHENASLYSRTISINSATLANQEAALGLAYWHQVTTVVIL